MGERKSQYRFFGQDYRLEYLDLSGEAPPPIEFDLRTTLLRIAKATTGKEVFSIALQVAKFFGFESVTYGSLVRSVDGPPIIFVSTPLPLDVWKQYHESGLMEKDEVLLHCFMHRTPGIWRLADSDLVKANPHLSQALGKTWASRIFTPLFGPLEEGGVMAWNSTHPAIDETLGDRITDVMMHMQMIAIHIHEQISSLGLLLGHLERDIRPESFSETERSILVYLSKGNRVAEIAELVELSAPTINYHLQKLKKRLFVQTVGEMLARATEVGIISPSALRTSHSDRSENLSPFKA